LAAFLIHEPSDLKSIYEWHIDCLDCHLNKPKKLNPLLFWRAAGGARQVRQWVFKTGWKTGD
jgi:hypothetical protein